MSDGELTSYSELAAILDQLPVIVQHTRRQRGLSQRAAAAQAGISFSTVSRIESGDSEMTTATCKALLRWLA